MIEKKLMHTNTSSIVNHINNENKILNNHKDKKIQLNQEIFL